MQADFVAAVGDAIAAGKRVALATVIATEGGGPRDPGAAFAVADDGTLFGAVSSGCLESTLVDEAQGVFADGDARVRAYGPEGDPLDDGLTTFGALTCGGSVTVLIEPVDPLAWSRVQEHIADANPAAWVRRLGNGGGYLFVTADAVECVAHFEPLGVHHAAVDEARAMLAAGADGVRAFGPNGEPVGDAEQIFVQTIAVRPTLYIVGAVDFAGSLIDVGALMGYRTVLVDPREAFASRARFPNADAILVDWPDEALAEERFDERSAIVVLTHDAKFDVPFLCMALARAPGYIGVLGSRATHARRVAALREHAIDDAQLARLHAPVGLDIGARTPIEVAISIMAEVVAVRNGRSGGRLAHAQGPIRGPLRTVAV
jgi:xanthine dehydrogenase accessory factor